ncbi:hypothetical protein L6452_14826 [Arctium lappa]|uniref:Uncharacterized protein n=1 Tax=Arctium lappa TaxID=4217 RepID=A0ACB9CM33_ARCLA|nr:hypothetical protein L6452_14826 [Arctium lappa]
MGSRSPPRQWNEPHLSQSKSKSRQSDLRSLKLPKPTPHDLNRKAKGDATPRSRRFLNFLQRFPRNIKMFQSTILLKLNTRTLELDEDLRTSLYDLLSRRLDCFGGSRFQTFESKRSPPLSSVGFIFISTCIHLQLQALNLFRSLTRRVYQVCYLNR